MMARRECSLQRRFISCIRCMIGFALVSILVQPASAQDPAVDDFERHSLGPDWIVLGGTQVGIVGNSDLGVVSGSGCAVGWIGSTFGVNQWSEAVVSTDIDPNMLTQVYVRLRDADRARYGFHWNGDPGNSRWEIKYDGVPTIQTRILASLDSPPPAPGDTLTIAIEGVDPVVIRGYHNGERVLMATDAEPQRIVGAGLAGVVARMRQGTANTPPTPIFESWAGGTLTDELRCRYGNVAQASGPEPAAVLTIDGSSGDAIRREHRVPRSTPFTVALAASPEGSGSGNYAVWAWRSAPFGSLDLLIDGSTIGCVVLPTPVHVGQAPQPIRCLRGGLGPEFCGSVRELPGAAQSAPWVLTRSQGIARPLTITLQGVLEDQGASGPAGIAVTNAIVLTIE